MKFQELLESFDDDISEVEALADLRQVLTNFEFNPAHRSSDDVGFIYHDTDQLGAVKTMSARGKAEARRLLATFVLKWLKHLLTARNEYFDNVPAIAEAHQLLIFMKHVKDIGVIDVPEFKQVFAAAKKHIDEHVSKHDVHG